MRSKTQSTGTRLRAPADIHPQRVRFIRQERVPIGTITPGHNPRTYTQGDIESLASDILKHGQLQPVIVREVRGQLLLGAGSRRYAAMQLLVERNPEQFDGMVLVTVLEPEDEAAWEDLMLSENLQRRDLSPLEVLDAINRRAVLGRRDAVESVADELSLSQNYVTKVMKLRNLAPEVITLMRSGDGPSLSQAALIALLTPADQVELLGSYSSWENVTMRMLRTRIEQEFLGDLDYADFDLDDTTLVPAAGACTACPKRGNGQAVLFAEFQDGEMTCTDPVCFKQKTDAYMVRKLKALKKHFGYKSEPVTFVRNKKEKESDVVIHWHMDQLDLKHKKCPDVVVGMFQDDEGNEPLAYCMNEACAVHSPKAVNRNHNEEADARSITDWEEWRQHRKEGIMDECRQEAIRNAVEALIVELVQDVPEHNSDFFVSISEQTFAAAAWKYITNWDEDVLEKIHTVLAKNWPERFPGEFMCDEDWIQDGLEAVDDQDPEYANTCLAFRNLLLNNSGVMLRVFAAAKMLDTRRPDVSMIMQMFPEVAEPYRAAYQELMNNTYAAQINAVAEEAAVAIATHDNAAMNKPKGKRGKATVATQQEEQE